MMPVDFERAVNPRLNKVFLGGLVISMVLHLGEWLWLYLSIGSILRPISPQEVSPLTVKLVTTPKPRKKSPALMEPTEILAEVEQVAAPEKAETAEQVPSNEIAIRANKNAPVADMAESEAAKKTEPETEAKGEPLDLSASSFSVSDFSQPGSQEVGADASTPDTVAFSGLFDPRLRAQLQAASVNRTGAEVDAFEVMNNSQFGDGSERVSFGDACFQIADAIGGGTDDKQVFRTHCLGKRDLSERMLDNVEQRLKEKRINLDADEP